MTSQKKKISDSDAGEPGKPNRKGDIWGWHRSILSACTGENRKRQMQSGETGGSQWVSWSTSHPMVSEKESSWGGIQPMLFLFLCIGTYCIYAIFLQVKKPYLKIKLLLLMTKVIGLFQLKKILFFFLWLFLITHPSAAPPSQQKPSPFYSPCYAEGWMVKSYSNSIPQTNYSKRIYWLKRFALWTKSGQKDNGK